jgi:hypothetical protein
VILPLRKNFDGDDIYRFFKLFFHIFANMNKNNKRKLGKLILFVTAILTMSVTDVTEKTGKWEKIKVRDGVTVYTRENSLSEIKEVKAVTIIDAAPSILVHIIKSAEKQPQWAYSTVEAKVVKVYDNYHWVTYTLSDAPWPVSDRDVVTDVKMKQLADSTIIIKSVSIDSLVEETDVAVRVPLIRAYWVLKQQDDGKVKAVFQILVDLGGSVPAWVVNLFIENGPLNTVAGFRKEAEREVYKNIKLPYIKEK